MEYGSQYDSALHMLLWDLLVKLEKLFPVPDLKQVFVQKLQMFQVILGGDCFNTVLQLQTAAWLSSAPSGLEACIQPSCEDLSLIYQCYKSSGLLKSTCK